MNEEQKELRERFFKLRWNWHQYWDSDPDRTIAIIEEAISIAEALDEPRWVLEMRHWHQQVLLFKKRDYATVLPMAIESVIEAKKPTYRGLQTGTCLYQDLIIAYVGTDAITHETAIEKALESMLERAAPESQCARCLLGEKTTFEIRVGRLEAAKQTANHLLSKAVTAHHRSSTHESLAIIAYHQSEWTEMLEHAKQAEKLATDENQRLDVVMQSQIWQAIALHKLGRVEEAAAIYRRGIVMFETNAGNLGIDFWDGTVIYLENSGQIEEAVKTRSKHLDAINDKGALRESALAAIDLCRLKQKLNQLKEVDIERAHAAIKHCDKNQDLIQRLDATLT